MKTDNIFKEGDKVYHFLYGWGKVVKLLNNNNQFWVRVQFDKRKIEFEKEFRDGFLLSFTEYTLDGFSQERPEELPNKGDVVWVRDNENDDWVISQFIEKDLKLNEYIVTDNNPFLSTNYICTYNYAYLTTENPYKNEK